MSSNLRSLTDPLAALSATIATTTRYSRAKAVPSQLLTTSSNCGEGVPQHRILALPPWKTHQFNAEHLCGSSVHPGLRTAAANASWNGKPRFRSLGEGSSGGSSLRPRDPPKPNRWGVGLSARAKSPSSCSKGSFPAPKRWRGSRCPAGVGEWRGERRPCKQSQIDKVCGTKTATPPVKTAIQLPESTD